MMIDRIVYDSFYDFSLIMAKIKHPKHNLEGQYNKNDDHDEIGCDNSIFISTSSPYQIDWQSYVPGKIFDH